MTNLKIERSLLMSFVYISLNSIQLKSKEIMINYKGARIAKDEKSD